MKRINIALLTGAALFVAAAAHGQGVDFSKVEIKTTDLGNKTYMLEGQGGNITVAVGSDGIIMVDSQFSPLHDKIKAAIDWIKSITQEAEVGAIYDGKVVKVVDFGAFVNFFGAKDGLVHVSQISNERVAKPSDVLKEGQTVKVKLLGFDDRGKTKLSMKVVDQVTGEDLSKKEAASEEA